MLIKFRNPAVSLEHSDRTIAQMLQAGAFRFSTDGTIAHHRGISPQRAGHWILARRGEEFLVTHSDDHAWYDRQPWKLILPAAISFFTTVLTMAVGHWLNWKR